MLTVPREVVARSAFPAVLDPSVSVEYLVDDAVAGTANTNQSEPITALAAGTTNYLGLTVAGDDDNRQVIGIRVDDSGNVLDPTGLVLSSGPGNSSPAVGSNGAYYLVVWAQDSTSGSSMLLGARVTETGTILDPTPFVIANETGTIVAPRVASDGSDFFVMWTLNVSFNNPTFQGAALHIPVTASTPQQSTTVTIPASIVSTTQLLAFDGTDYVVLWDNDYSTNFSLLAGERISTSGNLLGKVIPTINFPSICDINEAGDSKQLLSVASGNGEVLVSVQGSAQKNAGCALTSYLVRLGPDLQPKDTAIQGDTFGHLLTPVAFNGTNYQGAGATLFQLAGASDTLTYGSALVTSQEQQVTGSTIACHPAGCLVGTGLNVQRVAPNGTPVDAFGFPVYRPAVEENAPAVAAGGGIYLVAWQDTQSNSTTTTLAGRVGSSGMPLDPVAITLGVTGLLGYSPDVAFDGTDFMVLTAGAADGVAVSRISTAGTLLDPSGIHLSTSANTTAALTCGSASCLVLWGDGGNVYDARVAPNGALLDSPRLLKTGPSSKVLDLAFNGQEYLALFYSGLNLQALRLDPSGVALDTTSIAPSSTSQYVATSGSNFLLIDQVNGLTTNITGSLLDANGAVLNSSISIPTPTSPTSLAVTGLTSGYALTWDRNTGSTREIFGATLGADGSVTSAVAPLASDKYTDHSPALATGPSNVLLAYQHFRADAPYGALHVGVRLLDPNGGSGPGGTGGAGGSGGASAGGGAGGTLAQGGSSGGTVAQGGSSGGAVAQGGSAGGTVIQGGGAGGAVAQGGSAGSSTAAGAGGVGGGVVGAGGVSGSSGLAGNGGMPSGEGGAIAQAGETSSTGGAVAGSGAVAAAGTSAVGGHESTSPVAGSGGIAGVGGSAEPPPSGSDSGCSLSGGHTSTSAPGASLLGLLIFGALLARRRKPD